MNTWPGLRPALRERVNVQHTPPSLLDQVLDVAQKAGSLLGSVAGIWVIFKWVPKLFNSGKLVIELDKMNERALTAERTAEQYKQAADAYREHNDALSVSMEEALKAAQEAKKEAEQAKKEAVEAAEEARGSARLTNIAITCVVDQTLFMLSGRPLEEAPPIPNEIQGPVYDVMARLRREVPKPGPPFFTRNIA